VARRRYRSRRKCKNPLSDCSSGCQVFAAVGGQIVVVMAFISSVLCLSFGFSSLFPFLTEFRTYTASSCTIVGFNSVVYTSAPGDNVAFIGIAAVTLTRTGETQFAAVMQAKKPRIEQTTVRSSPNMSLALSVAFGTLQIGDTIECGIPPPPQEPVLFQGDSVHLLFSFC
jgi:hypothetical protein